MTTALSHWISESGQPMSCLWLQPLSVCQELCCSSGHGRQSLHQPPAGILPNAEHETSAQRQSSSKHEPGRVHAAAVAGTCMLLLKITCSLHFERVKPSDPSDTREHENSFVNAVNVWWKWAKLCKTNAIIWDISPERRQMTNVSYFWTDPGEGFFLRC